MKQNLGLRILSRVMEWDDDRSRTEFDWLKLMSRLKYDGYQDFLAGARFIESLITWLQQFNRKEREIAYQYIKDKLIYIGPAEMQRLVENFYPEFVARRLVDTVAKDLGIPPYTVWANTEARSEIQDNRRKTLFMGLSDGARTDILRRANIGILTNEQVVVTTQLNEEKWGDLLKDLKEELGPKARFSTVYLIDDFTASGTSLIRYNKDKNEWIGKLRKFKNSIDGAEGDLGVGEFFEDNWQLHVHHYLASHQAKTIVTDRYKEAMTTEEPPWFPNIEFSYSYLLPENLPITENLSEPFLKLVDDYYDPAVETKHNEEGGERSIKYGYGKCALPLVFEHNTPNNSLPLLWADTLGEKGAHAMRPLFRRRQRHS